MVGLVGGRPAVFVANIFFPSVGLDVAGGIRNIARVVCLPDFQGIGLGNRFNEFCASLWAAQGWRVHIVLAHPQLHGHLKGRSDLWKLLREKSRCTGGISPGPNNSVRPGQKMTSGGQRVLSTNRITSTFRYVGPKGDDQIAKAFEIHEHPLKVIAPQ